MDCANGVEQRSLGLPRRTPGLLSNTVNSRVVCGVRAGHSLKPVAILSAPLRDCSQHRFRFDEVPEIRRRRFGSGRPTWSDERFVPQYLLRLDEVSPESL